MYNFLKHRSLKKGYIFLLLFVFYALGCQDQSIFSRPPKSIPANYSYTDDQQKIAHAFTNGLSDIVVSAQGVVTRLLPDDLKGQRHQRLIVRLSNGQTLLLSHNIDLAARIDDLKPGERVYFRGEYEWNDKGGIIHWTHHAPQGHREGGWIDYKGMRYQ